MKTKLCIILFVLSCVMVGCQDPIEDPIDFPIGGVSAPESIEGKVVNEEGMPLEGIKMEAYLDEQLTEPYRHQVQNWNMLSDDIKKEFALNEPIVLTDSEGYYLMLQACCQQEETTLNVYVVASDPEGIYETQVQKALMTYRRITHLNGSVEIGGYVIVDFVLTKKVK